MTRLLRNRMRRGFAQRMSRAFLALYAIGWALLPIADARFEHRRAEAAANASVPAADVAATGTYAGGHVLCDLITARADIPLGLCPAVDGTIADRVVVAAVADGPRGTARGQNRSRAPPTV